MMRFTKGKAVKDMSTNYNPTNLIKGSLTDLDYHNINLAGEKERMSMTGTSGYSSGKPSRTKSITNKNSDKVQNMKSMRKQVSLINMNRNQKSTSSGMVTNINLNKGFRDGSSGSPSPGIRLRNISRSPSPNMPQQRVNSVGA